MRYVKVMNPTRPVDELDTVIVGAITQAKRQCSVHPADKAAMTPLRSLWSPQWRRDIARRSRYRKGLKRSLNWPKYDGDWSTESTV